MVKKNSTHIVILGGGFGGVATLKRLHQRLHGQNNIRITLVNRENHFLFTPLLHEVATGSIAPGNIVEPLRAIAHCADVDFYEATVEQIDCTKKQIATSLGVLPYDYAVIALGAETNDYGTPGVAEHCFVLKSLSAAVALKNHIIACLERAAHEDDSMARTQLLTFVVVGGGATGVELSAELSEFVHGGVKQYYRNHNNGKEISIVVVQKAPELLLPFSSASRAASLDALKQKQVEVRFGQTVTAVEVGRVQLSSGEWIKTATPIWVAGVRPSTVRVEGDIARDPSGRIGVTQELQVPRYPSVFAIGDIAACPDEGGKSLPQLAQVADRQGPWAADNIIRLLNNKTPIPFRYRSRGNLVSIGRWMAIAELPLVTFRGRFAWWLWRTIYLSKLLTWSKRIQVAADWSIGLFQARDISRWDE